MKRYGYIRTSTNRQHTDRQINELEGQCDRLFIEDGVSARKKNRPVYRKMLRQLKPGDTVVVIAFDRVFRNTVEALNSLDALHEREITLESITQRLDLTTPDGRFFFTLTIAAGEWELEINSQRTIDGLKAAIKRGSRLGRPPKRKDAQCQSTAKTAA